MRSYLKLALLCAPALLFAHSTLKAEELEDADRPEGAVDEDEDRLHEFWESTMTPEEYRNALDATGMLAAPHGTKSLLSSSGWTSIGPVGGISDGSSDPMRKWNGRIACIGTVTTSSGFDVYVGGSSGGFWRASSSDGIGVWTSLGDNLPNGSVRAFSVNPNNFNDILVGTGDRDRIGGSGMYRTLDGGGSWSQVALPVNPKSFARIDRSPSNANLLVAACMNTGGILRSTDGGASWTNVMSGTVNDLIVDPTNFNLQYAALDNSGAFKSTNAGLTWTNLNVPLPAGVPFKHAFLAVCRGATQHIGIFVSQAEPSEGVRGYQVLHSTNSGSTWTNITGDLGGWHMAEFFHTGGIAFRPNNPNELFVSARGTQRTTDNGAHWIDVIDTHADVTQIRFFDQSGNDFVWICMDGGVIGLTIGGSAQNWNGDGSTGLRCSQIDFLDAKRFFRTIGLQDNGVDYSTDSGNVWKNSTGGDGLDCEIVDELTSEFWSAGSGYPPPGILIYRQKGSSLTLTNNTAEGMDGLFFNKYSNWMFSVGDDDIIWGCDTGASSLHWVNDGSIPSQFRVRATPTGSYVDGRTLYMNVVDANGATIPTVLISRAGTAWTTTTFNFGGSGGVQSIYASTENSGEAWATLFRSSVGESLIFHTQDFGVTWTDITGNLSSLKNVRCIVQKPFDAQTLWVGTDIGVFRTLDGGASWQPFQTGLPIVACTDLAYVVDPYHNGADELLVSTYGRGLYSFPYSSFGIVYVDPNSPRTTEDGTYDHPYDTFNEGLGALRPGGSVALYGNTYSTGPITFSSPITLRAYGGTARFGQ